MIRKIIPVLLIISAAFNTNIIAQERIYLPYFEVMNLPAEYSESATNLYLNYLRQHTDLSVQTANIRDSVAISESKSDARESAEAWGMPYYLKGELNKMGETILVTITLYATSGDKEVWRQAAKAASADDVHILLERFAMRSALENLSPLPKKYRVTTEFERKREETAEILGAFGVSSGTMVGVVDGGETDIAGGLGVLLSFDAGRLIFNLNGELFSNETNRAYYSGIDVLYTFGNKPNAFYAMSGLAYGYYMDMVEIDPSNQRFFDSGIDGDSKKYFAESDGSGAFGFIGGGYIINRDKSAQLRLGLKGFYAAFDIQNNQSHQPFGGMFTATLLIR